MRKIVLLLAILFNALSGNALKITLPTKSSIESYLTQTARETVYVPNIRIDSVVQDSSELRLYANINLSYIRFDNKTVADIYKNVKLLLPENLTKQPLKIITDTQPIEYFVSSNRSLSDLYANPKGTPVVKNISHPWIPLKGLSNTHLAIWHSHGLYYSQSAKRWEFQRAKLFQTVEDMFTQSFVLQYLTPMLQNAGAYVFIPREQDMQTNEVITDNDGSQDSSEYLENNRGDDLWTQGGDTGFANKKSVYLDKENPFRMGTYREIKTTSNILLSSSCEWIPDIPEKGKYAVYVSYKSLPNSTQDAQYIVYHLGGLTKFTVNQQMGGGTWIFLGFFSFDKGKNENCKVVLTNYSKEDGKFLTADAVKIGGGMGNIDRSLQVKATASDSLAAQSIIQPQISHFPRRVEGARYWLQWAGVPDSVYSRTNGENDYSDDFQSRGFWVNYLAGGSSVLPAQKGLNVPVDLALALHTDAGAVAGDSIVGTLGICMTQFNNQRFENGKTRWTSRDLTEYIMDEVVTDIRTKFEPKWTRRQLWNRSYSEARVPNVPTTLLELLSHQNFADMRYGLDPNFRFTVGRAIYKGMLKFLAQQHQIDYVVQPLPVMSFYTRFSGNDSIRLAWRPTNDPTEPTAKAKKYIVYTREENRDFDNGKLVSTPYLTLKIEKDKIYSFKVTAVNEGGESFPSEILSVCKKSEESPTVLIVNGFDRVSAPESFMVRDSTAGFADYIDHGVPYINEYHYVGPQTEFNRQAQFVNNSSSGFGASSGNFVGKTVAGNSFDYPLIHGKSISSAGYSFVSSSRNAVTEGSVNMNKYFVVDIILGKQKETKIGRGAVPSRYKTFDPAFQTKIASYCSNGGRLLVSGSFVGSDLWKNENTKQTDINFAIKVLKYNYVSSQASSSGEVVSENQELSFNFEQQLNNKILAIESPDAIEPIDARGYRLFKYADSNLSAGIFYKGNYSTCVLGFPIEAITEDSQRDKLMNYLLRLFSK